MRNIQEQKYDGQNKRFTHGVRKNGNEAEKSARKNRFFPVKFLFPGEIDQEKISGNSYNFTCPKFIETKKRKKF